MSAELQLFDGSALTAEEKSDLEKQIETVVAAHKDNRQAVNRLIFESTAVMAEADDDALELSSRRGLRRFWGAITGSNKRLQDKINANHAAAQYAAQQTINKIAEQNVMTFDLLVAVNNKLNASMVGVGAELNRIYTGLLSFFKQYQSELVQIANTMERVERNLNLLNWQNSIEYQMLDGVEYAELNSPAKIVCLARDFYDITHGNWETSELLLLKTAMNTIDLPPRASVPYYDFVKAVGSSPHLLNYLLGDRELPVLTEDEYLVPMLGVQKIMALNGAESYIVNTVVQMLPDESAQDHSAVVDTLARKYLAQTGNINVDTEISHFDLLLELLFDLRAIESIQDGRQAEPSYTALPAGTVPDSAEAAFMEGNEFYTHQLFARAVESYRTAADMGHIGAQTSLGFCLETGAGTPQDVEEAVEWYRKAAEQNDAEGQYRLANCFYDGIGVQQDYHDAARLYQLAADQNHPDAQYMFGACCETGEGVAQSDQRAFIYYSKAAEQNHADGMFKLGMCYVNGTGTPLDSEKAEELMKSAAEKGNRDAEVQLLALRPIVEKRNGEYKVEPYMSNLFVAAEHGSQDARMEALCRAYLSEDESSARHHMLMLREGIVDSVDGEFREATKYFGEDFIEYVKSRGNFVGEESGWAGRLPGLLIRLPGLLIRHWELADSMLRETQSTHPDAVRRHRMSADDKVAVDDVTGTGESSIEID